MSVSCFRIFVLLSVLFFSFSASSSELIERVFEGRSDKVSLAEARKEILKEAVEKSSEVLIKEMIGEDKFLRHRRKIFQRIIKNSGKYISYIKSSQAKRDDEGAVSMAVTLKFSQQSLQALLLKNALMYENDSAPSVLPLIVFADRVHLQSYRWWNPPEQGNENLAFLKRQQGLLTGALRDEFSKKGFFLLTPADYQFRSLIPKPFRQDRLQKKDYLFLGELFESQLIIHGEYKVVRRRDVSDSYQVDLKLYALHSGNGRVLAEVHRTLNTSSGNFRRVVQEQMVKEAAKVSQDIVIQVLETWQRGTFGASLLKVSLSGDRLSYKVQRDFKKAVKNQLRSVKNVRERFFSARKMSFEMDVSKGLDEMKKDFSRLRFGQLGSGKWRLSLLRSEQGHLSYRPVRVP